MTILVTGATGNVGAHVVRLLSESGAEVRAAGRDLSFAGADRLFLSCANVPDQVAFECAAIDAAAAAGVKLIVKLSGPDANVQSPLIFEQWHGQIEQHLAASGIAHVLLRPRTFMTNLFAYAPASTLFAPAGEAAISFVDPRDVADCAAAALTGDGHAGRTYTLTGPAAITYAQIADELSRAIGRTVAYVHVHDDQARAALIDDGLPPFLADAIVAIFRSQRAGSMAGTTADVLRLTGHEPRTFAQFARGHAAVFRG
ncbi:NmrA family NAD(P)-binding protein [Paractinoplanes lichenicola]|uniref:NmrA family NAD(P)-binding protein n=1 Tax=Paractinoplanes lichenicola TaxID=2802976 RepID=A0ABS1VZZ5_9ACTN|nr:NmrA family NAD(P)-binding protein [Actinoplanes lichenicola]MBL7260044.1 NmrA family NAD(P)-binding protein [Actinoplanes lichenicola]